MYLAMRGLLALREAEGASSRHIGRTMSRLVVRMGAGLVAVLDGLEASIWACRVAGCTGVG